ncbi:unnamed protein product [Phytophthora lilii]|uniref:Unnamed protein product n=1 Tax=Phytophthora lilii TaxID=2077276 RepID=A0A9W6TGY6_9STRA|nr:unnamed protein product [Phytophthora lilii]
MTTKSTKPSKPLTRASTRVAKAVDPATTNDATNGQGTSVVEGPHVPLTPYQRMQELLHNTANETDEGPVVVDTVEGIIRHVAESQLDVH